MVSKFTWKVSSIRTPSNAFDEDTFRQGTFFPGLFEAVGEGFLKTYFSILVSIIVVNIWGSH